MIAPPVVDVHLLGQPHVSVDGVPVRFAKRATTLAMIAYLILQRGRAVPRETLAFTLFAELPEADALKELRRYLYLTQKALPAITVAFIEADADTVRWNNAAPAAVDVWRFEELATNPASYGAAVDTYTGDLLPEIYDDWIVAERERLRTLHLTLLSSLIVTSRSSRDYGTAIAFAQRLLANDPWREDAVRQLIAARYELGDSAGAIAEYERFARSTRAELGIEPMPETRALRDAVARGTALPSSLDRNHVQAAAGLSRGLPFAGRQRDLTRLRHAWERAARSGGGLAAIEGEPGIGKSRLAAEFALIAEAQGGRTLAGTTSFPELAPYQSVVEALRSGVSLLPPASGGALRTRILAQILPELQSLDGQRLAPVPDVGPERRQSRLFEAIGATFVELARVRPLCVVLEDLHWAGGGTLELLRSVARRAAKAAVFIIVTFRDEEVDPEHPLRALVRDLVAERVAIRVPLAPLDRDEIAGLVAAIAPAFPVPLDGAALFAQSEGNPLFLSEAIAEALDARDAGSPATGVNSVIERRLERLSAAARHVGAVAAVCGNTFDADVVCNAAGANGARGLAAIDELLDRQIIREAGSAGGFAYAFAHHLIAASLSAALTPAERTARHARIARALERFHHRGLDAIAAEIARHYAGASEPARAAHWYARAARAASTMFAHAEAVRFADEALARGVAQAELTELLLLREAANARLGRRGEQARDLDRLDVAAGDVATRCESLRRRIALLRAQDDRDAELAAIAALRTAAASDARWLGVANCAQAWLEISLGRFAAAEPLARDAIERLDCAGDLSERLEALSALVEIEVATGRRESAERLLERSEAIAQEGHGDGNLAGVLMQGVATAMTAQQFERAFTQAERAAALYRSLGDVVGEARALANVATAAVRQSRWAIARSANLRAATTFELSGETRGLARVQMNLAMLHGRCGAFAAGRRYLHQAREQQRRLGDDRALTASLLNESFLALWQGQPEEARALAAAALERAACMNHASYHAQALANLGAAERDLGLLTEALAHMEDGLVRQLTLARLPDAVSDLADLALAHAMRGDLDRALERVEAVLGIDRTWTNAAIFPPYPLWVAARVLRARRDSRAPAILASALALSREYAASIDVPDLRASFLELSFVAQIDAAAARDTWPSFEPVRPSGRHASGTAT